MKTIAELAKALDERGASITIQQDTPDDEGEEAPFVCWLFDPVNPSVLFSNDDDSLEVAIAGCFEAWDAESAETEKTPA
jgi:hypothetical protein